MSLGDNVTERKLPGACVAAHASRLLLEATEECWRVSCQPRPGARVITVIIINECNRRSKMVLPSIYLDVIFVLVLLCHPIILCPTFGHKKKKNFIQSVFKAVSKTCTQNEYNYIHLPYLTSVPDLAHSRHLGCRYTHVSDSLVIWEVDSHCKIQVLFRNFHELQNFHLHFCQPQTACVVERILWCLPVVSRPCFFPKNIHLLTLENAKGQWEQNPWTVRQEAFLSGWALTVEMQECSQCAVCQTRAWSSTPGLDVCSGVVDNHHSPQVCLWVSVFPFSPLLSEPQKVNNTLRALGDSVWSGQGHPCCRSKLAKRDLQFSRGCT